MTAHDSLADLLTFPYVPLEPRLRACMAALRLSNDAAADAVARFYDAIQTRSLASLQEEYTDTFDLRPACSLELGWHLFSDSRERGSFLAVLRGDLQRAGVEETAGLPDHLAHLLALVAREPSERAAEHARLVAPAITSIRDALSARHSPYSDLLEASGLLMTACAAQHTAEESMR